MRSMGRLILVAGLMPPALAVGASDQRPTQRQACRAVKPFTGNLQWALRLLNVTLQGGVIVNLGAALVHPGKNQRSAFDDAWNLFLRSPPDHNLSMVAFEGQAKALRDNDQVLNQTGGKFFLTEQKRARLSMIREYCDPYTLVRVLQERAVPRAFLFLKIDIDSIDLHVFDVIARSFRPALVVVERGSLREARQPRARVGFAALRPPPGERAGRVGSEPVQRPARTRTQWSNVVCAQCDTTMWLAHAPRRGYTVVQGEGKNFLMVPSEYSERFAPLSCTLSPSSGAQDVSVPPSFLRHVEEECAADGMAYTLELDGVCCPSQVGGEGVHLKHCRCLGDT